MVPERASRSQAAVGCTLGALRDHLGAQLRGDPERRICGVAPLDQASGEQLAFLASSRYRKQLPHTRAGAVILKECDLEACQTAALIVDEPYLGYARAAQLLFPLPPVNPGIAAGVQLSAAAEVHNSARVDAGSVIEAGAVIGPGVWVGPGCVVGSDVVIGADSRLLGRVSLMHGVRVGSAVILHPGVVIGSDGFGFSENQGSWVNIPQRGGVRIGDRVEIGANTTVDRGTLQDTVIADGVKLDNQVHVGHNVEIGANTIIAGCTGIAGSTQIGSGCRIGGDCAINGHIRIADGVTLAGSTRVAASIPRAGVYASALPETDIRTWRRNIVQYRNLDRTLRRLGAGTGSAPQASAAPVLPTPTGVLDARQILRLLPHRYPFMLIDRVTRHGEDGSKIYLQAIKNVSLNEPFFQGHFPTHPIMPGVLVLEALAQAAAILYMLSRQASVADSILYLTGLDKVRFKRPVYPGDQLLLDVHSRHTRQRYLRCICSATVGSEEVATAILTAVVNSRDT